MSESRIYDAALKGDVDLLRALLDEDPLLLKRVSYSNSPNKTPLQVATIEGHSAFVKDVLRHCPQLAEQLDAQQSTLLHIASGNGHVEIVKTLLLRMPDMCLSRDCQGRNPVHIAAMKGHVDVLLELVDKCPMAAREKVGRGLSVLGLCVKFSRLDALKALAPKLKDLVDWKDDDGDNILHMGIWSKQVKVVEYLVKDTKINVHAENLKGQTPWAMLGKIFPDEKETSRKMKEILKAKVHSCKNANTHPWLAQKRDAIMVVAVLIATMAFQAGVTPPGGVWQDDSDGHRAGEAVIAYHHPKSFRAFMRVNTTAFISSLSTILLLISGLPFKRRPFMWILMVIMWLTITSIAATYAMSIAVVTPIKYRKSFEHVTQTALVVWCSVMGTLLVGNTVRFVDRSLRNCGIVVGKRFRPFSGVNCV